MAGDPAILVISGTYQYPRTTRAAGRAPTSRSIEAPGFATVTDTGVLAGTGAYEGLTAYLVFDFRQVPVAVVGTWTFPGRAPSPRATFQ